jgi:hypothetical protein
MASTSLEVVLGIAGTAIFLVAFETMLDLYVPVLHIHAVRTRVRVPPWYLVHVYWYCTSGGYHWYVPRVPWFRTCGQYRNGHT